MTSPAADAKIQSSAVASSIAVAGAVVTTLASFLVAILVSQESKGFAGAFFTSTAVATILGNALALGTPTALVYFMPQAVAGDEPSPRGLIRQTLRPVVALSCLVGVAVFFIASPFAELVADDRVDEITTLVRSFSPAIPAWAITASLLGATRGLGSMSPTVLVGQVLRPGGQILLLGALFLRGSPTPLEVGLAWMVPVIVAMLAALIAVTRLGGFTGTSSSPVSTADFWEFARPRSLANALQIALERIDVIFVQALLGADAAGVYGALTRYIAAGNFLIFAVAQAVSATLRRSIAAVDFERAGAVLRQTTAWLVLAAWPYFLIVALKPEPLADLLNSEFVADAGILSILAIGMMVSAAAGPIDLTLLMLGKSKLSLAGVAVAIVTDITLLFVLAPLYGLAGAAIAWSISVMAQNFLASYFVRRHSGLTTPSKSWFTAAAIALVAAVPVSLVTPNTFAGLIIAGIVGGAILVGGVLANRSLFFAAPIRSL